MSKNKKPTEKYVRILDKFGLLPQFDFTKKERKIVKYLAKNGDADILTIGDHFDYKPEKTRKLVDRLLAKGAVTESEQKIALTPIALQYIHTIQEEKKSAKKFYQFVDALSEKELDEFMNLVCSFKVAPKAEEQEAPKEEEKPAPRKRGRKPKAAAEPKKEEASSEEPKTEEKPAKKVAAKPARKRPARRKPAPRKPKPAPEPAPVEEPVPEAPVVEEPPLEEAPAQQE